MEKAKRLVEFRVYHLVPGMRERFHKLVETVSLPMLASVSMEVVAHGCSVSEPDGYYLVRAYDSPEHLAASQDSFYTSEAWLDGPREAIVSLILWHESATMWLTADAVAALREGS